ncbi:MAG: uracil phosphoribosyltransferase [Bacilli bacterium]|nr:uracil phosphoribosyltransferase [Bacilli bacterium]
MDLSKYTNVTYIQHPLLKHKISMMRCVDTPTAKFRQLVKEVAVLEGYEAFKTIPTQDVEIQTPIEKTVQPMVEGRNICFVPILRAGLGMVDGMVELIPNAHVGHLGMYRNEETHMPVEYYCKLPLSIAKQKVFLLDPMLATGGSAIDAVESLIKHGVKDITFICIIAAPEGVAKFAERFPDIPVYVGALDRELNENAYICPGLGDCGDRIFGTQVDD